MISYNEQTRLKTAVELLKVTSEIEKQVEKVSFLLCFPMPIIIVIILERMLFLP